MMTKQQKASKTFNILSIGQRGVGKTVFLAGSHLELETNLPVGNDKEHRKNNVRDIWFECEDKEAEDNLNKIVRYIRSSGEYPPPTMKITDFSFNLCQKTFSSSKKLCSFIWSDIPGEICENSDRKFKEMVYASHGCCVFIDLYALINDPNYTSNLAGILEQVVVIANLTQLNSLNYPFSVILTKCDLISPDAAIKNKIELELESLIDRLSALRIDYQVFFSFIPITKNNREAAVEPQGAAAALLWLVSVLEKNYKRQLVRYISTLKSGEIQKITPGSLQSVFLQSNDRGKKGRIGGYSLFSLRPQIAIPAAIATGIAALIGLIVFKPDILPNGSSSSPLQVERRQQQESIAYLEKLAEDEPDRLEWKFQLAELYQATGDNLKSEATYDRILTQEENNITALVNKAILRNKQGDRQMAIDLFNKAEQVAPNEETKAQVRVLSQKNLGNAK
jgi:tetratricopeptide (TPR) repeat protein